MLSSFALKNLKGRQGMVAVVLLVLVTFVAAEAEAHTVEESAWASFKTAVFFRVFSFLAEQGYADAQTGGLAFMYEEGHGVPHDQAEARRWYLRAAEQGDGHAQFHFVNLYRKETGVEDNAEAYRQAAEQGDAIAQINLAYLYVEGQGVPQDAAEALRWYRQAAEQGQAIGQFSLGFMYEEGHDVPQDAAEALRWYRQAAEQGQAMAQFNLGFMYRDGKGVPQSDVQAYQWFTSVAAGLADSERDRDLRDSAMRLRSEVASNMTPDQVVEAERLASEWQAGRR